jgi:UDP-N-acetyl-D-glucosamine dehydrogenase
MDLLNASPEELKNDLRNGKITVAVFGLGHVGLGITSAWLRAGAKVIGVDVKTELIESINNGVAPMSGEPGIPETIRDSVAQGKLRATVDGILASKESDVKIIAVPTTLTGMNKCDLSILETAMNTIGEGLKKGDLVIIESSVPPTTTTRFARTVLERISRLKTEEDFGLAYSPERIFEGRILEDIEKRYPKVVGGIGPRSTQATAALYEVIAQRGVMRTSSPTVAEASKVFEGIYRDVNIALANELGRFCGTMDIDYSEAREVANSQPFCHLHIPGFVGGWCIPFYPYFVLQIADERKIELPLITLARRINRDKPNLLVKVADSIMKETRGKGLKGSRVAVLGLSFRADVPDTRNSPSYEVIDLLLKREVFEIRAYDPYVAQDANLQKRKVQLTNKVDEATKDADLILIMTEHSVFRENLKPSNLLKTASSRAIVIDGRHILREDVTKRDVSAFSQWQVEGFRIFAKRE